MEATMLLAEKYKKIFFLQDEDVLNVKNAGDLIANDMNSAFAEFYAWIEYQTDLQLVFTDAVLDEIAKRERDTWLDLIQARADAEYVERQQNAGKLYQRLGIPFEAYLTTLVAFHEIIENIYVRRNIGTFKLLRSFKKLAGINICIAIDTYNETINETMRAQNAAIMEMSTPVAKLWEGILFLPLVGIIDSKRAQNIMVTILQTIAKTQAQAFILDISGVGIVDTAVANYLIKMTKATKLMGCLCIISGILPDVAQTIVELGIQTDEIHTTNNLEDALKNAFEHTGTKTRKKKSKK